MFAPHCWALAVAYQQTSDHNSLECQFNNLPWQLFTFLLNQIRHDLEHPRCPRHLRMPPITLTHTGIVSNHLHGTTCLKLAPDEYIFCSSFDMWPCFAAALEVLLGSIYNILSSPLPEIRGTFIQQNVWTNRTSSLRSKFTIQFKMAKGFSLQTTNSNMESRVFSAVHFRVRFNTSLLLCEDL